MVNYYEEMDFEKSVYYVDWNDEEVVETTLGELCTEFVDTTTTPLGVGPRYHARNKGEHYHESLNWGDEDGWEVWTWGFGGNNPRKIESFDTQDEAVHALDMLAKHDLDNSTETPTYYYDKDDALEELNTNDLED